MDTSCGIGCRIATLPDGRLHFAEVHAWGGAAQSGDVIVGDVLNSVNGAPVTSRKIAKRVILGEPGTSLTLGIRSLRICARSSLSSSQPPAAAQAFTAESPLCAWHVHRLPRVAAVVQPPPPPLQPHPPNVKSSACSCPFPRAAML